MKLLVGWPAAKGVAMSSPNKMLNPAGGQGVTEKEGHGADAVAHLPGICPERPPGRPSLPAHTSPCLAPGKRHCVHSGASPVLPSSRSARLKAWARHPDPCLLSSDGQGLPLPLPFTIPASAHATDRARSTWTMPSAPLASTFPAPARRRELSCGPSSLPAFARWASRTCPTPPIDAGRSR